MIPDSTATLVAFLLFLAPGTIWEWLRTRHVPSVRETTLLEVCRVVLVSLAATTAAALTLIGYWFRAYESLAAPDAPQPGNGIWVVGLAVATAVLACGYVLWVGYVRWPDKAPIKTARVWHRAFVEWGRLPSRTDETERDGEQTSAYLEVELVDGTVWKGVFAAADSDPEDNHRNLALQPPLYRRRLQDPELTTSRASMVLLPEREIRSIQVTYPARARTSSPQSEAETLTQKNVST